MASNSLVGANSWRLGGLYEEEDYLVRRGSCCAEGWLFVVAVVECVGGHQIVTGGRLRGPSSHCILHPGRLAGLQ